MSALRVKGKIVGKTVKTIRPRDGENFDMATYYIVGGGDGGRPVEVKSYDLSRKAGQTLDIPVYVRAWKSERSYGANINEAKNRDNNESSGSKI